MLLHEINFNIDYEELERQQKDKCLVEFIPAEEKFAWTAPARLAAQLMSNGKVTAKEICQATGLSPEAFNRIKSHEIFQREVDELIYQREKEISRSGFAQKANRILALNDIHERLSQVIQERAQQSDPRSPFFNENYALIPGMSSGLIVTEEKSLGMGSTTTIARVDTGIVKSMIEVQNALGTETGQKTKNIAVAHTLQKSYGFSQDII